MNIPAGCSCLACSALHVQQQNWRPLCSGRRKPHLLLMDVLLTLKLGFSTAFIGIGTWTFEYNFFLNPKTYKFIFFSYILTCKLDGRGCPIGSKPYHCLLHHFAYKYLLSYGVFIYNISIYVHCIYNGTIIMFKLL